MYGRDLREAWRTMPAVDLTVRVKRLAKMPTTALADLLDPEGDRHWGAHEENTARLYEVLRWQGGLEWADRTVDPEEARRRAAAAKREGIKPPEHPLIPPVAVRPRALAEVKMQAYLEEVKRYSSKTRETRPTDRAAFDRAYGLA